MGHSVVSDALGTWNLTCTSTILSGCRQNIVTGLGAMTLLCVTLGANGCTPPVFVLVFKISNCPLQSSENVISAFESLLNVSFWTFEGASGKSFPLVLQYLMRKCFSPSCLIALSSWSCGAIVTACKLSEMLPRVPFLGIWSGERSLASISSCEK